MGAVVALSGPAGGALVQAAEGAADDRLAALRAMGRPELALTRWRAETLKIRAYDGDLARIAVPADADADWVRAMADPSADLSHPMKGPFRELRGGDADQHRAALRLAKQAHLLPAALVLPVADAAALAAELGLSHISLDQLGQSAARLREVASARVPLSSAARARVRVFRPADGGEEHYAVVVGRPAHDRPVLARLHSACFTGDVIGSLKCDCGPQLNAALGQIGAEGAGILLYLNQEGRGIGLANKMRAYALQDQGFDTVEANHRLGFEDDERDFRIGAEMLRAMGVTEVRLMTNNPAKVARMQANGVAVAERVPLRVGRNPQNADYLETKARKSGHLL
ncbi:GTP cyclohydrolase II [Rhodobacteraceae bacterium 2CG4]|uniref:GTP cyclohydrolase-2 n=1 Tax=Halovulum marinum TaxID=2662447 RepID=A0A6L5Z8Z1_9RHOB|nr:GTP cyclohydrolase II [Halovulum marinum]MSU92342.1 GTP cyclohydrolase II [Halovulum marinum]